MTTFRTGIETTDADQALAFLQGLYPKINLDARPDAFSLHLAGAGDDRLSSFQEGMSASGWLRAEPQTAFMIVETYEGVFDCESLRHQIDTSRPCVFPPNPAIVRWYRPFSINALEVDIAALDEFASDHFGVSGLRVRFSGNFALTRELERSWRALSAYVRNIVFATDEVLENRLIRDSSFGMVAAAALATFPNNTLDLPDANDGLSAVPAAVRRAIAFMEDRIAQPISLEDIAGASRLSPRGLQDAFIRIVGVSPTRYLRRMRLEAAHADLVNADSTAGDTVAVIARRWGFAHLARFSARYRQEYGEYPADTLRN